MSAITPEEFKARLIENMPELPPELWKRMSEFIRFPEPLVQRLNISQSDKAILSVSGLPRNASPFLTFGLSSDDNVQPLSNTGGVPELSSRYRMIGNNGSGDTICIDEADHGSIVCLNHDFNMQRDFMNSSITALAECLCAFARFMKCKDADACRREFRDADPAAMTSGAFWPREIESVEQKL
ncbi:MAG: SUKH-4 family immunity protein [Planctomycetia bacterium]|nr:SUKH-4 family immunity protein [Planctomycetia bacterium]